MYRHTSVLMFACPKCDHEIADRVDVPLPDWSGDNADERMTSADDYVDCPNCNESYLVNIDNMDGTVFAALADHQSTKVSAGDAELESDEEWYDPPFVEETVEQLGLNLGHTLNEIRDLLALRGDPKRSTLINRMAFVQLCGSLEAYLQDTLLSHVLADAKVLEKLVMGDKLLVSETVTLADLLRDPAILRKRVRRYLQEQLYHNLAKVAVLYKIAFEIELFSNANLKKRMHTAMSHRHDCVHRNGHDIEGQPKIITVDYVLEFAQDVEDMKNRIEAGLLFDEF